MVGHSPLLSDWHALNQKPKRCISLQRSRHWPSKLRTTKTTWHEVSSGEILIDFWALTSLANKTMPLISWVRVCWAAIKNIKQSVDHKIRKRLDILTWKRSGGPG